MLSLLALLFAAPALKSFSIPGLFEVEMQEVERRASEKATEQVMRLFVVHQTGEDLATAQAQAAAGAVRPLPEE